MLWLLLTALAPAQEYTQAEVPDGLNAQLFRPSIDSERTLWTNDTLRAPNASSSARALLSYTSDPMVYVRGDGERTELVSGIWQMDLMGAHTRGPVRFGVDLPLYLRSISDVTGGETGLGDAALDVRWSALDRRTAPVGAGLAGRLVLPTATVDAPLGLRAVGWEIEGLVDAELGDNLLLAANLGTRGLPPVTLENTEWGNQLYTRMGAGYEVTDATAFSLDITSNFTYKGNASAAPIEALLGARQLLPANLVLRGGVGTGLTKAVGSPAFRAVLSIGWEPRDEEPVIEADPVPAVADTDGDGLLDDVDACPDQPEDTDGVVDDDGCPEPTPVSLVATEPDGTPIEGVTWTLGEHSGAEPVAVFGGTYPLTADAEGYFASSLQVDVPDAAEHVVEVVLQPTGTLLVSAVDSAGNAVADASWHSASFLDDATQPAGEAHEVPEGPYSLVVQAPGYRLQDRDVEVVRDTEVEVQLTLEPAAAEVIGERIDIRESVYFETNLDAIQSRSLAMLDEIAEILAHHPELTLIRIEGHTDSRGDAAYNKDLSQRRADAVRAYLMDRGVEGERLKAVGFGEERPLRDEETPEAWEINRRVDFFVEERTD